MSIIDIPEYSFTIHTGQDILVPVRFVDSSGEPESLVGYDSFSCEFRQFPGTPLLGTATVIQENLATGLITIQIDVNLTKALEPFSRVSYDLFAIAPDGTTRKLLMGLQCNVVRRVTETIPGGDGSGSSTNQYITEINGYTGPTVTLNAVDIPYSNANSDIVATNVKAAIDELANQKLTGFADYNDSSTSSTPIQLIADTWTTITNDGAGAFTNLSYLPDGVTQLIESSQGSIDCRELSLGDVIFIRNDFRVTPSVNGAYLQFRYQLGSGLGLYYLTQQLATLSNGSGQEYKFQFIDKIYMGDANTRDNPIYLQINSSEDSTLVNNGSVITVLERN